MRRATSPSGHVLRPPMRHIHRSATSEADMLFQARSLADAGDRVNLIRGDGQRFTVVRNGKRYLVRDGRDEPIATHDTVRECVAAGDVHLDEAAEARAQREANFGGDDPGSAA